MFILGFLAGIAASVAFLYWFLDFGDGWNGHWGPKS